MIRKPFMTMIAIAAHAGAASAVESTYTIVVPPGETNGFTAAQIEAVNSGGYVVLAKRGGGCLVGTNAISAFPGEIRIEEGAYWIRFNGELGTAAGSTSVSNGAALYVESPSAVAANSLTFKDETFFFAGSGVSGEGAFCNRSPREQYNFFLSAKVNLTGDALFTSKYRIDARGTSADMAVWDFGGHSFTYKGIDTSGIRPLVSTYGVFTNMADFAVNRITLGLFSNSYWHPGAGRTFALENYAELITGQRAPAMYRDDAGVWRSGIILSGGAKVTTADGNANYSRPFANCASGTNVLNFAGPASLSGTVTVRGNGYGVPFTFGGPVSGSGTLNVTAQRLQFASGGNTYGGRIVVSGGSATNSGIRLYRGANMPPCGGQAVSMSDARLRLDDYGTFELGPFSFQGDCEIVGGLATGTVRSTMSSLVKTGGGTLLVDASLDVAGETRLEGGTLKLGLPKVGNPGLGEGWFKCRRSGDPSATVDAYNRQNAGTWASTGCNGCPIWRREGPAAAFSRAEWFYFKHVHYHGWVWNRTGGDATWNIAGSVGRWSHLYIDGTKVVQPKSDTRSLGTVTLSPGAHEIEISLYAKFDSSDRDDSDKWFPGPSTGISHENWWPWTDCGLAYDPQGRTSSVWGSTEAANAGIRENFRPFMDPGDGSLFTIDNKTPEEIDRRAYHPFFSNLVVMADAAVDLAGNDLAVGYVGGAGVVSNGTLTVRGGLIASAANETLRVDGPVVFAPGACIRIPANLPHRTGGYYTVLSATGAVSGIPNVDRRANPHWYASVEGGSVRLSYRQGMIFICR